MLITVALVYIYIYICRLGEISHNALYTISTGYIIIIVVSFSLPLSLSFSKTRSING